MNALSPTTLQKARQFHAYGYVAEPCWSSLLPFTHPDFALMQQELACLNRAALMQTMHATAHDVFARIFQATPSDIFVPLSGGRDSRLILCMAREFGLISRIVTVNWGMKGGLDWTLAASVARHFGVQHIQIDIGQEKLTLNDLRCAYHRGAHWTDLALAHFNQAWRRYASSTSVAVIGYLGGPPVGGHYDYGDETLALSAAITAFDRLNKTHAAGPSMISSSVRPKLIDPRLIGFSEQLDLVFRQEGYLRRIVAGTHGRTPYADPDWMRFCYALPPRERAGTHLYSEYLLQYFPDAFSIGVSGAVGLNLATPQWRRRLHRRLVRASHALINLPRSKHFATLDKYGDQRDLWRGVADAYSELRMMRSKGAISGSNLSARTAATTRRNFMLACNLFFEAEAVQQRPLARSG